MNAIARDATMKIANPRAIAMRRRASCFMCLRRLTFDMRGGRQLAKPDVGRPFDGRVRALVLAGRELCATSRRRYLAQPAFNGLEARLGARAVNVRLH